MSLAEALAAADLKPTMARWFRYVGHGWVAAYKLCGWSVSSDLSGHHSRHSVLMRYDGEREEPPCPIRKKPLYRPKPRSTEPRWRR